jgi:hypothetical protein
LIADVTVIAYNNTMCSPNVRGHETFNMKLGCRYDTTSKSSYFNGCSLNTTELMLPVGPVSYATYSFYDDDGCSNTLSYQGSLNGACIPVSASTSVRINYPAVIYYVSSADCTGRNAADWNYFKETCAMNDDVFLSGGGSLPVTDDPLDVTYLYRSAGLYGHAPTPSPVQAPTKPPSAGWVYTFMTPGGGVCSDEAPLASGYATNSCMLYNNQSMIYSCSSSKFVKVHLIPLR